MRTDHDVRTATQPDRAPAHEHAWQTESAHRTSLGLVRYVRCAGCAGRRVDLQPHPQRPPAALSVAVPAPPTFADQSRAGAPEPSGSARH